MTVDASFFMFLTETDKRCERLIDEQKSHRSLQKATQPTFTSIVMRIPNEQWPTCLARHLMSLSPISRGR